MTSFFTFLLANVLIGFLSFGGGNGYIPVFQNIYVDEFNIITNLKLAEVVSYILIFPGPVAPMIAGVIGYEMFQIKGVIFGLIFLSLPMLLVFMYLWKIYQKNSENKRIQLITNYLSPAIIALFLSVCLSLFTGIREISHWKFYDLYFLVVFLLSTLILSRTKIHPVILIIISGFVGYYLMSN